MQDHTKIEALKKKWLALADEQMRWSHDSDSKGDGANSHTERARARIYRECAADLDLLLVVGQPRDHVVDTATMMTDTSSPSQKTEDAYHLPQNARPRIIFAGWQGLKGDPESHEGGSAEGYLAAARETLAILEQRIREQFTPALNTGTAMNALVIVDAAIRVLRSEIGSGNPATKEQADATHRSAAP